MPEQQQVATGSSAIQAIPIGDSWYTGANIAGKPRSFPIFLGGVGVYREICAGIAANGYERFTLS